ncbi:MAG TPA: TlpA disulfide reductase family protein [Pyrinomonadaceae bacterium]|nr:TlpA disulfide reductase family protein [Pyrinomonadaceae bacterium]
MYKPLLLVIFLITPSVYSQTAERYYGKFLGLQADSAHMVERVLRVGKTEKKFIPAIDTKATIAAGKLTDPRKGGNIEALIVELPTPLLAIDANADNIITIDERFELKEAPVEGTPYFYAIASLPLKGNPLFNAVPIYVRYFRGFKHPRLVEADRLLDQSVTSLAIGEVKVGAKSVRFQYPFVATEPSISTTEGLFGVDIDGDTDIRNEQFSLETSYANNEEIVLRVGEMYLSTTSIDLTRNEIVVRRREKADYLREELTVGKAMPNFSFVDFAGKRRSLEEFRGKYLLIEWWGVWCIDCVRDTPYTVQAYERFRSRGFEIVGLNWDDRVEDATAFVEKSRVTWPQARKDSINALTETIYRIQEFPSSILLDAEGKVVSLNQKSLQGPRLIETLDKILSASNVSGAR